MYLLLAELSKGASDVVVRGPLHEYLFIWHNDGYTGSLEAVSVEVGLGHVDRPYIDHLYLLRGYIFSLYVGKEGEGRKGREGREKGERRGEKRREGRVYNCEW